MGNAQQGLCVQVEVTGHHLLPTGESKWARRLRLGVELQRRWEAPAELQELCGDPGVPCLCCGSVVRRHAWTGDQPMCCALHKTWWRDSDR